MSKLNNKWVYMALVVALVVLGWVISPLYVQTYLVNTLHKHAAALTALVLGFVGAGVIFAGALKKHTAKNAARSSDSYYRADSFYMPLGLMSVPVVLGILVAIGFGVFGSYAADKALLPKSVEVVTDPVPTFDERTAWEVARNRVASDKGDLVGKALSPRYLPSEGVFTSLVESNKTFGGYTGVVEQTIAMDGATTARTCEINPDSARLGGWFGGNLERAIAKEQTGLVVEHKDAYGYCDSDDNAVVIVPVKKLTGFYPVVEVAAGVAKVTDAHGVEIIREVESSDIPGPVYPTSLAARQREALVAHDASFIQWLRKKAGFEEATTDGDPNSENPTEFSLNTADGSVYVSPMTTRPKQEQARISAYAVVDSDYVSAGSYNTLRLHIVEKDERREANGVVVDNLKSFYADADFGWAQGLRVFEMLPTSSDEWVASLGFEKSVKYRVRLAADGSSCLEDADGNKIRCVDATGSVISEDGDDTDESGNTTGEVPSGTLRDLTNDELAQLQEQVVNEMVRRLNSSADAE